MDILLSFKAHIHSEKLVGIRFVGLGILLLLVAGYVFIAFGKTEFTLGLKWTSLVLGVLMIASGLMYRNQNVATQQRNTALYQSDKQQFLVKEVERATKLTKGYGHYRLVWLVLIVGSVAVIWFLRDSVWSGIAYAIFLFTIVAVVIEGLSELNTRKYVSALEAVRSTQ